MSLLCNHFLILLVGIGRERGTIWVRLWEENLGLEMDDLWARDGYVDVVSAVFEILVRKMDKRKGEMTALMPRDGDTQ